VNVVEKIRAEGIKRKLKMRSATSQRAFEKGYGMAIAIIKKERKR